MRTDYLQKMATLLLICIAQLSSKAANNAVNYLFKNKTEGYKMFRIPAIISTNKHTLIAFCEGRRNLLDHGDIDLVMKTSYDNGTTWSPLKVLWNYKKNTCGNPTPVIDRETGEIILLATLNNNQVVALRSKDEGIHWEEPEDITHAVKPNNWDWYATGPVHAIQLKKGPYTNRLIAACNHTLRGSGKHISHIIYSDNSGNSWKLGGSVTDDKTDECTVAELPDGSLLLNMRNNDRSMPCRKISYSTDGGSTWTTPAFDSTLIEPVCQGALLSYHSDRDLLLFSNPMHRKRRKHLTLSISSTNGRNWDKHILLNENKSAYSDLVQLPNGDVLCIYETGRLTPYCGISLKLIQKEQLEEKLNP